MPAPAPLTAVVAPFWALEVELALEADDEIAEVRTVDEETTAAEDEGLCLSNC